MRDKFPKYSALTTCHACLVYICNVYISCRNMQARFQTSYNFSISSRFFSCIQIPIMEYSFYFHFRVLYYHGFALNLAVNLTFDLAVNLTVDFMSTWQSILCHGQTINSTINFYIMWQSIWGQIHSQNHSRVNVKVTIKLTVRLCRHFTVRRTIYSLYFWRSVNQQCINFLQSIDGSIRGQSASLCWQGLEGH